MNHEDVLNMLLSHSCSNPVDPDIFPDFPDFSEYVITLHCARFTVVAKPLGCGAYEIGTILYDAEYC